MKTFSKYALTAGLMLSVFAGCKKEYESIEQIDERKIQNYISANNLSLTKDPSGIYYQILTPGTGEIPQNTEKVFFSYSAKGTGGKQYFTAEPYTVYGSYLGYVQPEGWHLALSLLKRGGKIRVIFPSTLGFGRNGTAVVDGNEVLDSELELFNVKNQAEMDDVLINKFKTANNLQLQKHSSGIYYQIITPGTGTEAIDLNSTITMAYTGRLLNGKVFDSATTASPLTSTLSSLIRGWQEGVPLIKKGGKIRLLIPSALAYGEGSNPGIPANSVLDFDIELTDVKN